MRVDCTCLCRSRLTEKAITLQQKEVELYRSQAPYHWANRSKLFANKAKPTRDSNAESPDFNCSTAHSPNQFWYSTKGHITIYRLFYYSETFHSRVIRHTVRRLIFRWFRAVGRLSEIEIVQVIILYCSAMVEQIRNNNKSGEELERWY